MLRSGMIRQIAAGAYAYLPIGYRVLQKVTEIVREEMNRAGAIELHMPAMHPVELWQETGRVEAMGDTLIHLPDQPWRRGTVLGPTHEEIVTEIARAYLKSYKQLPVTLYQIQTKFRDEQRPKSGVLRTREFLMKDAYSFDLDEAGLDVSYNKMYEAYCRIYERCGLPYLPVEAESGAMGGSASVEFMVATEAGEDVMVRAEDGSYLANVERAEPALLADPGCDEQQPVTEVHTPGHSTIEQVSEFLHCRPQDLIKTIIYEADGRPLVALVRGDHTINEGKLARAAGIGAVEPAGPELIRALTGAEVGFAGPVGLKARIITDQAVTVMHNAATGANKTDYHITGVNPGRDFEITEPADIRYPIEGDRAPNGAPLVFEKCIEVGHVFKLGTKYTDSMKAHVLDDNGKSVPMIMGCYGIGVNRIVAAAIEACHDEAGICWPLSVAPFAVEIVALDVRDDEVMATAGRLHDELEARGVEVLLDDRDARPGFKFKDADLVGIPLRVTVGKRGMAQGVVEIKWRTEDRAIKVPRAQMVSKLLSLLKCSMTCEELQRQFLRDVTLEITERQARRESITAAFQTRNEAFPVYRERELSEDEKTTVRECLSRFLAELGSRYRNPVTDDNEHTGAIKRIADELTARYGALLHDGRFRIGIAQKALNLYLKYLWCLGKIPTPPHCPFDKGVIDRLRPTIRQLGLQDPPPWTELDSIEDYQPLVTAARSLAEPKGWSIAEWELRHWRPDSAAGYAEGG